MSTIPTQERPSKGNSGVMRAIDNLTPLQRKVFFGFGAALATLVLLRFLMNDIIRAHEHGSAWQVGAELGGSVVLLILAIAFMVPPFGMWLIGHIPLPKFLVRSK